jgi:hypothetical protein
VAGCSTDFPPGSSLALSDIGKKIDAANAIRKTQE